MFFFSGGFLRFLPSLLLPWHREIFVHFALLDFPVRWLGDDLAGSGFLVVDVILPPRLLPRRKG